MTAGVREGAVQKVLDVISTPTWFGPEAAPMAGWWHAPVGSTVRGVVVLCPPVGLELLISHRALRVAADRLARAGLGVLRFTYPTTGDSAGEGDDVARVERWRAGVRDAVAWVRESGPAPVVLAGLRLGATLAADAAAGLDGLAGVVLWDPCASGSTFLREEEVLFGLGVPESQRTVRADDAREGPGILYGPTDVASLRELGTERLRERLEAAGADVPDVAVLVRSGVRPARAVRELIDLPGVRRVDVAGQEELFDWIRLRVPQEAVDELVSVVDGMVPSVSTPFSPVLCDEAVVARTGDGRAVRERFVRLGTAGLLAVVTEADGGGADTIVLTNAAPPASHIGPARLWVDLARRWAEAHGVRVVRVDERGVGDSPGGDVPQTPAVYTEAVVADLAAVARALRADGAASITLVGLCAAAWACLRAAARSDVDLVYAVNPSVWDVRPAAYLTRPRSAVVSSEEQAGRVPTRWTWRVRARAAARLLLLRLAPEPVWWRLGQAGRVEAPAGMIVPLVSRRTQVRLLFGPREEAIFRDRRGARLLRGHGGGGVQMRAAADVDHALMSASARRAVVGALSDWVEEGRGSGSARGDQTSYDVTATERGAARHD